ERAADVGRPPDRCVRPIARERLVDAIADPRVAEVRERPDRSVDGPGPVQSGSERATGAGWQCADGRGRGAGAGVEAHRGGRGTAEEEGGEPGGAGDGRDGDGDRDA